MLRHCFIFVSLFLSAYSQSTLCSQWNEQPNTNTPGGTDMPVARTLDDCKSACLNSSTSCVYGFDWSTTGGTGTLCWISRTSVTTVAQGVSHYTCPSIKTTPGIQGSTTTTLPSGATARPACSSTLQYTQYPDSNIQGSIKQPSLTQLDTCQNGCMSTSWCSGIDWNSGAAAEEKCWFTLKSQNDIQVNKYPGVTHYHLVCSGGPATDSSGTGQAPAGCSWVELSNTNSPNGNQVQQANTLSGCKAACLASTDKCSANGFDWNPSNPDGSKCYLSTMSVLNSGASSISHFSLKCDSTTSLYVTSTPAGSYSCSWNALNDTNSPGGVLQSSLVTFEQCRDTCLQLKNSSCMYGFDWNPTVPQGSRCWFSTSKTTASYPGVTHYNAQCSLDCSWVGLSDTNSPGGSLQNYVTTYEQCRDTCLSSKATTCQFGFDWNGNAAVGTQCWFSTSNSLGTYIGVRHFNYVCADNGGTAGGCVWTPLANTNSPGGIVQSSTTTLDQCQSSCLQQRTTTCLFGFDWNPTAATGSQCWFSTSATTTSNPGVTHYNYNCIGVTTTGPSSGCSWITLTDQNSPGGILQNSVTSLDQCKNLCQQGKDTSCKYGIDWNTASSVGTQCWISQSNVTSSAPGINHLNLVCQGCSWNKASNTNSPGGNVQPSITTLQQCQDSCQQNPNTCKFGFDFNPNNPTGSQCWFSSSATTTSANGVDHYTYICNNPGITSTPSGVGGCAWNKASNTNSPGGIVQPSLTTLQQCQDSCQQNPNTCRFGFDFNPNNPTGSQCWFSSSATTTSANGVDHYAYSCNSVTSCSWNKASNTNSPGGIVQPSITTLQQCQDSCQQNPNTCRFGFDFNPNNPTGSQCWFSSSATTTSASGVDHYTYSCTSVTTGIGGCSWNKASNTNSPGGIVQPSLTTLQQCQDSCQQNPNTCRFGFDFNPNNPTGSQCWFSSSATTTSASGVDHYTYSCTSVTTGIGGCSWNKASNTNSPGGIVQPSLTTLQQCQDSCQQNPNTCRFGFDFNPNNPTGSQCWFSSSATTTSASGVDHYTYSCTSGSGGCTWNKLSNTNSPGGTVQPSITTLQQCRDSCQQNPNTCKFGFDFNPNNPTGSQCWFSSSATTTSANGVDHYNCLTNGLTPTVLQGCTWSNLNDTNTQGGLVQPSLTTLDQCKDECLRRKDSDCKSGFDWNPGNSVGAQCWFSQTNITGSYPGVQHYYLTCPGAATPAPSPACTWFEAPNTNSPGGAVQPSYTTIEACKSYCISYRFTLCKFGIDFNPTAAQDFRCWFSASNSTTTYPGTSHLTYSCV